MRFDLTDLRLFVHVAETGSITAGAGRAHLALASASERVRAMETYAGAALVERQHRGVSLTPAGRALLHHAREILDRHERLGAELARFGSGLRGHVRMVANTTAIAEHLPEPLAGFLAAHPHVDVDLEERLSREVFEAVAAGRAEVGVASDQVDWGELDVRTFRRDQLAMVASRDHPLAQKRRVAFSETLAYEHVGLASGAALQDYLAGQARRLGATMSLRVRVRGFVAVCRMAEHGVGLGIVPAITARRARHSMKIRVVPLSDPWAARALVVATRRGSLTPYAAALVGWLTDGAPAA